MSLEAVVFDKLANDIIELVPTQKKGFIALSYNDAQEINKMGGVIDRIRKVINPTTGKEFSSYDPTSASIVITQTPYYGSKTTDVCLSFRYERSPLIPDYYDVELHVRSDNPNIITTKIRINGTENQNGLTNSTDGHEEPEKIEKQLQQLHEIIYTYARRYVPSLGEHPKNSTLPQSPAQ